MKYSQCNQVPSVYGHPNAHVIFVPKNFTVIPLHITSLHFTSLHFTSLQNKVTPHKLHCVSKLSHLTISVYNSSISLINSLIRD